MVRLSRVLVGATLLGFGLACGGIWQEVMAESFSELTVDLQDRIPESDPNFGDTLRVLEDGWIAAYEGHVGMTETIPFSVAFDEATMDGKLEKGEVLHLREKGGVFDDHPVDATRREQLLEIKKSMDERIRAEKGGSPSLPPTSGGGAPGALAGWELPGGAQAAFEAAGWTVGSCSDFIEDDEHWATCQGQKGTRFASVDVTRYPSEGDAEDMFDGGPGTRRDGDTVLEVMVLDGAGAEKLRDAVVPEGTHLGDLEAAQVRKAIEAAGFALKGCDASKEDRMVMVDCEARLGQVEASVSLELQRGGRGRQQRETEGGVAMVMQGNSIVSVLLVDPTASEELAEVLTR